MRLHLQSFIERCGHETSIGRYTANRHRRGKTKNIPRTSVGLRSANSIQQGKAKSDNLGTRAIIQAGANTIRNSKAKG